MDKIQELVKEGKLSQTLMADKDFVNKAEKIFKSENIDIDDKKLKQIMEQIESGLKKSNVLDDKDLEEISGGLTKKGAVRSIVRAVTGVTMWVIIMGIEGKFGINPNSESTEPISFGNVAISMGIGNLMGELICEKLDSKNKSK